MASSVVSSVCKTNRLVGGSKGSADESNDSLTNDDLATRYKKMSQIEHILKLPDTYIGSTQLSEPTETWVWNSETKTMEKRAICIVPGLFKIFDEILVNAYDQWIRCQNKTHPVKEISVLIQPDGVISVRNDGCGIDVELHPEHGIWIPELIFGYLLTSANYEQKGKTTGGKNGYGAKLTNIYSKWFRIETSDQERKRRYTQNFRSNMNERDPPIIIEQVKEKPYTKIEFLPDYERFGITEFNADHRALFERRVMDLTACTDKSVRILLNQELVPIKTLETYVDCYLGSKTECPRVYEKVDDRWEIVATISPTETFQHITFVNGISTNKGGKHVDYLAKLICDKLVKVSEKKAAKKKVELKAAQLREHLWLFARTVIEDPSFDSQTKDYLTTPPANFGSKCGISDSFIEKLAKTGICEKAIALIEFRNSYSLQKSDGKKRSVLRGIPKLDDANWAGTAQSRDCTLILTEGDSAKTFAIAGLSVIGRNQYGVFPLRGKLLNVRDASIKQIADNVEINYLKQIIGLRQEQIYTNETISELRYGHIMLLTDADVDGSHIRGLLMNVFHTFWPSLLEIPGFLQTMVTPIVKARKSGEEKIFYSWNQYKEWKEQESSQNWEIRYYKGLGTSTSSEAKEYFSNISNSLVLYECPTIETPNYYTFLTEEDETKKRKKTNLELEENRMKQVFLLAFGKEYADDRKTWLERYENHNILDGSQRNIYYDEFIHKEFIHFSKYDCERSIPSLIDGLKPSQRKVVYAAFLRNLTKSFKVAQFAAYVAEKTAYHHGEQSLNETIIGLSQDFVGSNNFPLLIPEGQFGTRLQGGKDHASPRYIFTRMNPLLSKLFPPLDRPLLSYLNDDGTEIEPNYFIPILPLVLINGAEGIGTGFSCRIPSYHPKDLVANIKRIMKGEELEELKPWVRGFKGSITKDETGKWMSHGIVQTLRANQVEITELPVGKWTEDYTEQLEQWIINKKEFGLVDFEKHYTDSDVCYKLKFSSGVLSEWKDIEKELKLTDGKAFLTSNMHLFNANGQIQRYHTVNEILLEFYEKRKSCYIRRKAYQMDQLTKEIHFLQYRIRFIQFILDDTLILTRKSILEIETELETLEFPRAMMYELTFQKKDGFSYNYLIDLSIRSITKEKFLTLEEEVKQKKEELQNLEALTIEEIWIKELDEFLTGYESQIKNWEQEVSGMKPKTKAKAKAKK